MLYGFVCQYRSPIVLVFINIADTGNCLAVSSIIECNQHGLTRVIAIPIVCLITRCNILVMSPWLQRCYNVVYGIVCPYPTLLVFINVINIADTGICLADLNIIKCN